MLVRREGRVINISSIIASTGFNGLSVYGATKAGLLGFTKIALARARQDRHHREHRLTRLHGDRYDQRDRRRQARDDPPQKPIRKACDCRRRSVHSRFSVKRCSENDQWNRDHSEIAGLSLRLRKSVGPQHNARTDGATIQIAVHIGQGIDEGIRPPRSALKHEAVRTDQHTLSDHRMTKDRAPGLRKVSVPITLS